MPVPTAERKPPAATARDNMIGASWMIVSAASAAMMTIGVRFLSPELETPMIVFLRCVLGLGVVLLWLPDGGLWRLRFSRPWAHLIRGCLIGAALNLGFYAIGALPMATVTLLFFLAPVFATAFAGPMLGERVGVRRWSAVAVGFLGAMVILRPERGALDPAMAAAVVSSLAFALALLMSRPLTEADGARSVFLSSTVVAAVVSTPAAIPVWEIPGEGALWGWLALLVVAGSLRGFADIAAYAVGEIGFIAPFAYLRLLFAALAGWLLFRETLDWPTILGGAIIIGSTLYIAERERRLNRRIAGGAA